jgi:hypothetical protein
MNEPICCHGDCHQGRECPARRAPETETRTTRWSDIVWALAIGVCVAAIVVPLMVK